MAKLNEVLKEFRDEIGGDLIQATVCGADGLAIAQESIVTDAGVADQMTGRASMALQAAKRVTDKLDLGAYEESIATTEKIYVLTKFLGDGSYSFLVSVTRKAILGTVRMLCEEYASKLWDAIPR
jgi:predicted regulator of Ras-like GTPase activity (Roadblock/LC7/MglB family)